MYFHRKRIYEYLRLAWSQPRVYERARKLFEMSCARTEVRLSRSRKREITQLNFLVVFRARLPLPFPPLSFTATTIPRLAFSPSTAKILSKWKQVLHGDNVHEKSIHRSRSGASLSWFGKVSSVSPIVNRAIFRLKVTRRTGQGWLLIYRSFLLGKRNSERTCPKPETSTPKFSESRASSAVLSID